jgi:hypothetical protein
MRSLWKTLRCVRSQHTRSRAIVGVAANAPWGAPSERHRDCAEMSRPGTRGRHSPGPCYGCRPEQRRLALAA